MDADTVIVAQHSSTICRGFEFKRGGGQVLKRIEDACGARVSRLVAARVSLLVFCFEPERL